MTLTPAQAERVNALLMELSMIYKVKAALFAHNGSNQNAISAEQYAESVEAFRQELEGLKK